MGFLNKLFGGDKADKQGMAAQMLSQLTTDLNLTGEQLEKMKAAFQQFREQRKAAKTGGGDIKSQMQGIRQDLKAQVQDLLSAEQKQKFVANFESYKEFFRQ